MSDSVSDIERESMDVDLLVVGAGPAGLAAAIRAKQQAAQAGIELSVCVIEKAAEVGAHILSGAVMDPRALTELLPDWASTGAPLDTPVSEDRVLFLSETGARAVPHALLPQSFHNDGNYIVRLGHVVKWLGEQAEALGVDVFAGFAGSQLLIEDGKVAGVITGDMGLTREGEPGPNFAPGMALRAKYTLFAEGCRGHLGKELEQRFRLRDGVDPQTYGLGIKELWEVPAAQSQPGLVVHTAGWPMDNATYGGGFIYHLKDNLVAIGYVVGLNYSNPHLSPFEEFQRFKTHPSVRTHIEGGRRLSYGARAITAGGLQSLPRLVFPGGALIGDDAGFLNAARIKGSHAAIKSGMLAADAAVAAIAADRAQDTLDAYPESFRTSWLREELYRTRNFKPYMKKGLWLGSFLYGAEQLLFKGAVPWTLRNQADHTSLKPAASCAPIDYPKPDGVLTFDRLSSVFLSNTNHEEEQPCHLRLKDAAVPITVNLAAYDAPEQRYCPAGVYEIVRENDTPRLQINAQNCVHCKTCDIKDPTQNITWVTPQGGEGPIYNGM
ncbi:Electron transfer flavoprotein-ubiquinone oxidoreductase, ETF-QO [Methyloversatilis universalis FAM5]|uniref:Electron transfer flavoprotein-ubiquinone oxidoreductase n=1 Tax=Methyloversatilis universalis (strain ATCC BAA-1314 / DSM 25237 / JCM 13912 / CCUG 52030 / FAM5) TaxID=1000565 RepID=F5RAP5_METUF|nr:electron transfer flavoprotein-ubiquinone oxidoreductase [Methyloversatilis universalis]EGK72494.1 Electron transfer flavoprotein-ubiquinone oxidoreductase, ETF-QO [Methyloversatilis universalis FAM5]